LLVYEQRVDVWQERGVALPCLVEEPLRLSSTKKHVPVLDWLCPYYPTVAMLMWQETGDSAQCSGTSVAAAHLPMENK
jgi:hypothetical protein